MSRSKRPKCRLGRDCPVCGDAGEPRRERDRRRGEQDERDDYVDLGGES